MEQREDGPRHDDPDVLLMLRLQRGDRAAFTELLQRNTQIVFDLACRYLRDRGAAEDIVQETFLRVYQRRAGYQPGPRFSSWLLRVAANLCLSRLRRKRLATFHSLTGHAAGEDAEGRVREIEDPAAPAPDAAMLEEERRAELHRALESLPERQRMAVILSRFQERSYEEIGEILDLSIPAVKSLLHRARTALREELRGYVCESPRSGPGSQPAS